MERKLWEMEVGEEGVILSVTDGGRGLMYRLQDLGFTEGCPVCCALCSPLGDPTAYRVRGALIALRRRDADLICVKTAGTANAPGNGGCI